MTRRNRPNPERIRSTSNENRVNVGMRSDLVMAPSDLKVSESESAGAPAEPSAFQPAGNLAKIQPIPTDSSRLKFFLRFPAGWIFFSKFQPYFLRFIAEILRFQPFSSDSSEFLPAGMRFFDERGNLGGSSAESSWSSSRLVGGAHHYRFYLRFDLGDRGVPATQACVRKPT